MRCFREYTRCAVAGGNRFFGWVTFQISDVIEIEFRNFLEHAIVFIRTYPRQALSSPHGDIGPLNRPATVPRYDIKLNSRSVMKADSAIVMSFFKNEVPAGTRINLKWPDKHEVTDFKLDQLGELVSCETETDQTGWVIVKSRGNIQIGDKIPLLLEAYDVIANE